MARLFLLCLLIAGTSAAPGGFITVKNYVIKDKNDLGRLEEVEPEDCANKCVELEICHSFEYKAEHRKCDLSSAKLEENDLIQSVHGWEIYAMYPTPRGYFRVRNSVIEGQNDLGRLENVEPEDCAKRCEEMENCNSFEYKAEHRKCDLSSALLENNDLIKSIHGWEIYAKSPKLEKAVTFNAPERFFRVRNSVIEGKNDLGRLENVGPEECATKCLEMGLCHSFEYKAEHRKCDLSSARIEENSLIQSVYGWEIFARFPTPEGFFRVKNSVIAEKNDLGRLERVEPEDCAQKCRELENCHSFEYKDEHRKCDLSSARLEENDLIQSVHGWEIYAMYSMATGPVTERKIEVELEELAPCDCRQLPTISDKSR